MPSGPIAHGGDGARGRSWSFDDDRASAGFRRTAAPSIEDVVLVAALGNVLPFDVASRLTRAWDAVESEHDSPAKVEATARQRYAQRNLRASLALLASGAVALPALAFWPQFAGVDPTIRPALLGAGGLAWLVAAGALLWWRRREQRRLAADESGPGDPRRDL